MMLNSGDSVVVMTSSAVAVAVAVPLVETKPVGLARTGSQSIGHLNHCSPLWGVTSICGRRPEMEDAFAVVPQFLRVPNISTTMSTIPMSQEHSVDRNLCHLTSHFFGVYDGHGGSQLHTPATIDGALERAAFLCTFSYMFVGQVVSSRLLLLLQNDSLKPSTFRRRFVSSKPL